MIAKAKRDYYEGVPSAGGGEKTCFTVVNKLLGDQDRKLPDASSIKELCQRFCVLFPKQDHSHWAEALISTREGRPFHDGRFPCSHTSL